MITWGARPPMAHLLPSRKPDRRRPMAHPMPLESHRNKLAFAFLAALAIEVGRGWPR